jgi:TIR domain
MPVRVFISYAHEDRAWCERLLDHLGWLRHGGQLAVFDDRQIKPGERWDDRIRAELAGGTLVTAIDGVAAGGDARGNTVTCSYGLRPEQVEEQTAAAAARGAPGPPTGWSRALAPAAHGRVPPCRASAAAVLAWTTAAMSLDVAGSAVTQRTPAARAITSPCAAASSTRLPCQPGQPGRPGRE